MALSVPLSILAYPLQLTDADGNPLAGGKVTFKAAGTTDNADTFGDCQGDSTNTNPVILDSAGAAAVFLAPILYDISVTDADDVSQPHLDREGVGNPGQIFASSSGTVASEGSKNVDSGYTVLSTDNLVTVSNASNTNPAVINLPAASSRVAGGTTTGLALTIKNLGVFPLNITPNGSDAIENDTVAYSIPAATLPLIPTLTLVSDGTSAWWVVGGIGIT